MKPRLTVLTFNAALGILDYSIPAGMTVQPGQLVKVPLGPRTIEGLVWDEPGSDQRSAGGKFIPDHKLRPVRELIDLPPASAALRRLIGWSAEYYMASLAAVARMAFPRNLAFTDSPKVTEYRLDGPQPERMTPKRQKVFELEEGTQASVRELAEMAGVSEAVIRSLVEHGSFSAHEIRTDTPYPRPDPDHHIPQLNGQQAEAAARLVSAVQAARFAPFLLDGVTGSGKTEVYFEAMAEALRRGQQVLLLLPEIALTQPFLKRIEARFGVEPTAWHSGLRFAERRRAFRAIATGQAHIIIGARSALYLPYARPGLIIVDEAHETSFKQEDGVRYNARDVAIMRARFEGCPVILSSATPAIESRVMADAGRYETLKLTERYGPARLPDIRAINLSHDPPPRGQWLAPPLVEALAETIERGEQALLFLNRRGYAPLTLCRKCGFRFRCPHCSAWMVEHRFQQRLVCHHCGHETGAPEQCPECGAEDELVACGPGVERIAEEVALLMPEARCALVTSDTLWSPERAGEFVALVEQGAIDIIIGTQLVTKGYHFPKLTLVGVVDADIGLEGGDLRASERSFQQIAQVSGRAGRAERPGQVLVQSHYPEHPVIDALVRGDSEAFYTAETDMRRQAAMPPFGRLAAIIISSEDNKEAMEIARILGQSAPRSDEIHFIGPAPAPLSLLRGRYRHRILVHAKRSVKMQAMLRRWLGQSRWPKSVRVAVDIDPYSFV